MDADAILNAFLRRFVEDCRSPEGPKPLEDYVARWPTHREAIAAAYAEVLEGGTAAQATPSGNEPTERVGPYELVRQIGQGGQGLVYLARDTRLDRTVALKMLTGLARASFVAMERFRREAMIASRLEHPGICRVYEAGSADGIPYIAMQYLAGETLDRRIANARSEATAPEGRGFHVDLATNAQTAVEAGPGRLPGEGSTTVEGVRTIVAMFVGIARALHAAHEAGVIHRDIKPGNLMVMADGQAVILDFGLAAAEDREGAALTLTGDLFGTPAYMSPEQITAGRVPLDRRTDVYSLGITLFETLTGRRAFDAPNRELLYRAIATRELPDPRRLNPKLPRDLAVVVGMATEKERERRYATAADLADDLERILRFEPIAARPVGPLVRGFRWAQRHPAVATLAVLLVLVFSVATPTLWVLYRRAEEEGRRAIQAGSIADGERRKASELARDSEREVVTLLTRQATELHDRGDVFGALGVEAEAWARRRELAGDDAAARAAADRLHGRRVRSAIDAAPRLVWRRRVGPAVVATWIPDAGDRVAVVANDGVTLFDAESGRDLASPFPSGSTLCVPKQDLGLAIRAVGATIELWKAGAASAELQSRAFTTGFARLVASPDHRYLAGAFHLVSGTDRTEYVVLDGRTLEALGAPRPLGSARLGFASLSFSPDGETIAAASGEGLIEFRRTTSAALVGATHREGTAVTVAAFSQDGRHYAAGTEEGVVVVFDAETGKVSSRTVRHAARVLSLGFDPSGRYLVSGGADGAVYLCAAGTGALLSMDSSHAGPVEHVVFAGDGLRFLTAGADGVVVVRSLPDGRRVSPLLPHGAPLAAANFDGTGRFVVTVTRGGVVSRWDLVPRVSSLVIETGSAGLNAIAFRPPGREIATASQDGRVRRFDLATGSEVGPPCWHDSSVTGLDFDPAGQRLATVSDRQYRVFSVDTAKPFSEAIGRQLGAGTGIEDVRFTGTGEFATIFAGHVDVLDEPAGILACRLKLEPRGAVAWSPDRRQVVVASRDDAVEDLRYLDLAVDAPDTPLRVGGTISAIEFSPDGRRLAVATRRGVVLRTPGAEGEQVIAASGIRRIAWAADGSLLALATDSGRITVHDAASGAGVGRGIELGGAPLLVALSADGSEVAGVTWDGGLRLHDVATGEPLTPRWRHGAGITAAALDAASRRIALAGADGRARIVVLPTEAESDLGLLRAYARSRSARVFDHDGRSTPAPAAEPGDGSDLAPGLCPPPSPGAVAAWHRELAFEARGIAAPDGEAIHARAAKAVDPASPTTAAWTAGALRRAGRFTEALAALTATDDAETATLRALLLVDLGRWAEAREAVRAAPLQPAVRGVLEAALLLREGAVEAATAAVRPVLHGLLDLESRCLFRGGGREPALVAQFTFEVDRFERLFGSARADLPPAERLLHHLVRLQRGATDGDRVRDPELDRSLPYEAAALRALAAARSDRRVEALKAAEAAAVADPKDGSVRLLAAVIHESAGDHDRAREVVAAALEAGSAAGTAHALRALGHVRAGEGDLAAERFLSAWKVDPESARAIRAEAVDQLLRSGDVAPAFRMVSVVADAEPHRWEYVMPAVALAQTAGETEAAERIARRFLAPAPRLTTEALVKGAMLAFAFAEPLPEVRPWIERLRRRPAETIRTAWPVEAAWRFFAEDRKRGLAELEAAVAEIPNKWSRVILARALIVADERKRAAEILAVFRGSRDRAREDAPTMLTFDLLETLAREAAGR